MRKYQGEKAGWIRRIVYHWLWKFFYWGYNEMEDRRPGGGFLDPKAAVYK